jgi:SRSO17 transposase
VRRQDQQVAAAAIVEDGRWLGKLHGELRGLLAPVFAQARSRLAAFAYLGALLAEPGDRRSCWQLAEAAGHATPRRLQALLAEHAWDWRAALGALQRFIVDHLGDPQAVLVFDETAELKKGRMTVGVARQHAGITGQVENCQTVVNCAYVTGRAHALSGFRLCLPKAWCADRGRRQRAQVPREAAFQTKTELATGMLTEAVNAAVPFGWAAGDEVYGRSSKLRRSCEDAGKGYVFAVPVNFTVTLGSARRVTVASLARLIPARCWETRSCGRGCKGHRDWAWAATCSPRHWVLIRRSLSNPCDLAFFYCYAPAGRPVSLRVLIAVTGKRWPVEECHQQAKGQTGFDQHQVRLWHSFHRHTVLSMCALALLAIAAASPQPAPPAAAGPAPGTEQQPWHWRDTGILPASPDQPPPEEPGLVKISVPEARRLLRLATTPTTAAARQAGHAWSRWRRKHQARARWHHYQARLRAAAT